MPVFTPERTLNYLQKTTAVVDYLFHGMSNERAKQLAPGISGWNALEVMGHLVDLEAIFTARVHRILNETNPTFDRLNPDQMAADHGYAQQDIQQQVAKFLQLRREFITLLTSLSEEQWTRGGIHPTYGPMTLLDLATNTALHDLNHLGQISEVLGQ